MVVRVRSCPLARGMHARSRNLPRCQHVRFMAQEGALRKVPAAHLCGVLIPEGLEQPVVLLLAGLWGPRQALGQGPVSTCETMVVASPRRQEPC